MNIISRMRVALFLLFLPLTAAFASPLATAPDSTQQGSHRVKSAEYKFPAEIDTDVLAKHETEVWAKIFYPADIAKMNDKLPLVLFLHGNHSTCGKGKAPRSDTSCAYTETGTCPTGYVPVPNHEGYDYLAKNLTSYGYVVVSINANRGITCGGSAPGDFGLNLARGKLVLKHLSLLYQWASSGGAPESLGLGENGLLNKLDFANVGLMGHSRGGEGVRAAYNLYRDADSIWPDRIPGLNIKAIFEIGAVDGQTSRVLDANGTVWNQLLPMCDGDVADLEGRFPFQRMMKNANENPNAQKSLYEVWGANHNFFNTEWQVSDSNSCSYGNPIFDAKDYRSELQQKMALASLPAFFRSHLGGKSDVAFNQNFNPLIALPSVVNDITPVDRDFTPSPGASEMMVVDDFDQKTGINTSGEENHVSGIKMDHVTINGQSAAKVSWEKANADSSFELVFAKKGMGKDVHDFATLDVRVGHYVHYDSILRDADFSIELTDAAGLVSKPVVVSQYATIHGPGSYVAILKTVRIPLTAFSGVDLTKIHSVRFVFNKTESGMLYFANVRMHRQLGVGVDSSIVTSPDQQQNANALVSQTSNVPQVVPESQNAISGIRFTQKSFALSGESGVEITLKSSVPFNVMNRLPVLQIGNKQFKMSRYSDTEHLKEMTFTLTNDEYKELTLQEDVQILNGKVWKFGRLSKALKSH